VFCLWLLPFFAISVQNSARLHAVGQNICIAPRDDFLPVPRALGAELRCPNLPVLSSKATAGLDS